ncbi:MAG: sugar ABC transporter permease [Acutalibacter sp.]|nr:sugar ABC transporter permease [Acutalibacter sp.]NBJ88454.1 sugar ABC transporter permease [Acutalibacter sp. 1XD8-36]
MGVAFLLVFCFVPMFGIIIAFKDYKLTQGILGFFTSDWVGLKWFSEFYHDLVFWPTIRNTISMSLLKLVFTFPVPIIFALAVNEVRISPVKRTVQTISYLPHFISWVVVSGMLFSFLNEQNGLLNQALLGMGVIDKPISFLSGPQYFLPIVVISDIWKEMGWWAIIFLAAITSVDLSMYEAAKVDGAGRLKQIWHITLPSIKGTIVIVLIMSIGNLFGGGISGSNFDQAYMLGNVANNSVSEILQTYTLKMGLSQGRFSYATAISLMQSIISLILVSSSNWVSNKLTGTGLF